MAIAIEGLAFSMSATNLHIISHTTTTPHTRALLDVFVLLHFQIACSGTSHVTRRTSHVTHHTSHATGVWQVERLYHSPTLYVLLSASYLNRAKRHMSHITPCSNWQPS